MSAIPLDSKLGAAFLGNLLAGIFYGITCVQTYLYSRRSRKDGPWFRATIFFLWVLDTAQLAFVTHGLYYYMVSNFGNLLALLDPTWYAVFTHLELNTYSWDIPRDRSLLVALTTAPNKVLFIATGTDLCHVCQRSCRPMHFWSSRLAEYELPILWVLKSDMFFTSTVTKSYIIAGLIATTSILTFVTGFAFASRAYQVKTFANFSKISYFLYIALGSGVVVDLVIAGTLCYNLSQRRTGFKKTDSLVTMLIVYSINTSLLTTICSTACFITYAIWPDEFTFMGFYFVLSKRMQLSYLRFSVLSDCGAYIVFFNSLLATLNSRDKLAETLGGISNVSGLSHLDNSDHSNFKTTAARNGPSVVVSINRETVEDYEMGSRKSLGYLGHAS
ncbi:hypothetical protein H0H92_013493 [Tricholoma furcatifolium]|nr:hypothetical protein H0H92_013493 [Tricholoma furcatifolium]